MANDVTIAGVGIAPFGRFPDTPLEVMGARAARQAVIDAGSPQVSHVVSASSYGGMLVGQRIARYIGLDGKIVINTENACSGGATALSVARTLLLSGEAKAVLAVGADQLSRSGGGPLPLNEDDPEVRLGHSMPMTYAMRARRYLERWNLEESVLTEVSVKARRHGALNPVAQFQDVVTAEQVEQSRFVAEPLRLLHCCPTGDGAAAVVLVPGSGPGPGSVRIRSLVLRAGTYDTTAYEMGESHLVREVAQSAYEVASAGPEDIDVVELHDAFAIAELLYYEALGLCAQGEAADLLGSGATSIGGAVPVNTGGGLLSRGHPIAATGLAQIVELAQQLRGVAGPRQVEGARLALAQVTGGGISGFEHGVCSVTVLEGPG